MKKICEIQAKYKQSILPKIQQLLNFIEDVLKIMFITKTAILT
jgi:hypothetical protein